jgi:sugar transferase (PEP-CTERM/EpsH1 system associated)
MSGRPPLILHVIHHLVIGGMENGLVNLINRMPATRFRHAIACIEDYSDFRRRIVRDDVEVYALNRSRVGLWRVRRELFRLARRLRPSIVHTRGMSGLDALLPTRLAGVSRHIHGEHGWDMHDLHGSSAKPLWLRRVHSPLINRYIAVSKHLERYLIERVGIRPSRITQIYNGVDTERFCPALEKAIDVFPSGFANSDSFIVGTVGRLQLVKDQATLIRAFAEVARQTHGNRFRLVIVGGGPLAKDLQSLVENLGVAAQTWLSGPIEKVPSILKCLDLFVLPSLSEGISNTILEAMACGVPVLATAVGGNIELVQDGRTGRLFQPGDAATLANLLLGYAHNYELRANHARLARARAMETFDLSKMVQSYQQVYELLP